MEASLTDLAACPHPPPARVPAVEEWTENRIDQGILQVLFWVLGALALGQGICLWILSNLDTLPLYVREGGIGP